MKKRKGKVFFSKETDRFESVSFVNDPKMTNFRLKMFIKQLWENLQDLANAFQLRRSDVYSTIDKIMDGNTWNEKDLDDRKLYGKFREFAIEFDTLDKTFTLMNEKYEPIAKPFKALNLKESKKLAKELRKNQRTK